MKTEQTKNIEILLRNYQTTTYGGIKTNKFRESSMAFEVTVESGVTQSGIVDAVEINEYFGDLKTKYVCRMFPTEKWERDVHIGHDAKCGVKTCGEIKERECDITDCKFRVKGQEGTNKVLVTCFEIKVSVQDFKSKHGHNFFGNCNYYVVPYEIFDKIKDLVPTGVGIITQSGWSLRKRKECQFREMTPEAQMWAVLCVLKKIKKDGRKNGQREG